MTIRWMTAAAMFAALVACAAEENAEAEMAATGQPDGEPAAATAGPVTLDEARRVMIADYIDGEEELVSLALEEVGENQFAGEMRWTHPVGGDLLADCTAQMERGEDGAPHAVFSTCEVRE
ncbi:MAG: hypothetical protein LC634_10425 [Sphingomonadales bacterium]|nr:hypothetical protein [Sphingomonadales bacterium]